MENIRYDSGRYTPLKIVHKYIRAHTTFLQMLAAFIYRTKSSRVSSLYIERKKSKNKVKLSGREPD